MSTEVRVTKLPTCDIHKYVFGEVAEHPAKYDGLATVPGHGSKWANMCEPCFKEYGVGLGTGRGQRLILITDSPKD